MLLLYASHDGQARRIAERIAARLGARGIAAAPRDLAAGLPAHAELAAAGIVVAVLAVRYGKHLPHAREFLAACRSLPPPVRLVLLSVNLVARKPGKDTANANPYLRKAITRNRLRPCLAAALAGRLDYRRYGWLDRQIIRLIMRLSGGPTDPDACVEFTPWDTVDAIADRISGLRAAWPA